MRKIAGILLSLTLAGLFLQGCDFFRTLAGRPTSEDLALLRTEREAHLREVALLESEQAKREQRQRDSLAAVEQFLRDSTEAEAQMKEMKLMRLRPEQLKGLYRTTLDRRYYVVMGSFRERANAEKKRGQIEAAGYRAEVISFNNGFHAIGAEPCDKITDALKAVLTLRQEPFCPADAWLLDNSR